jgi:hypothetical protein
MNFLKDLNKYDNRTENELMILQATDNKHKEEMKKDRQLDPSVEADKMQIEN